RSQALSGGGGDVGDEIRREDASGEGLVGIEELGAVSELDDAAQVIGGGRFHAGDEEANGVAVGRGWLSPGREAVSGVEAELDADVSRSGRRDIVLSHLDVVGRRDGAGGDHVDRGGGGFLAVGVAGGSDGGDEALRAGRRGVVAVGVHGTGGRNDAEGANEWRTSNGPGNAVRINRTRKLN